MPDPVETLSRCGGAARWSTLRDLGVPRGRLVAAVEAGRVQHVRSGLYAVEPCPAAAVAAAAVGGVLSCATALADHGVPLLHGHPVPHLTAARGTARTWRGAVVHRRDRPHDGRRVDLASSVVDAAGCLPLVPAVAAADAAVASGRVELADLPARRWWAPVRSLVDGRAQSVLESAVRVELVLAGVGPVHAQAHLAGVGHVDLLVQGWLAVETDGFAYHSSRESYREDRRRDDELARRGYVVLRFTYEDVVHRRPWLLDTVAEVLARGCPPHWAPAHTLGEHDLCS